MEAFTPLGVAIVYRVISGRDMVDKVRKEVITGDDLMTAFLFNTDVAVRSTCMRCCIEKKEKMDVGECNKKLRHKTGTLSAGRKERTLADTESPILGKCSQQPRRSSQMVSIQPWVRYLQNMG
jgi:hypothetical protein